MEGLSPAPAALPDRLPGFRSPLLAGVLGWVIPGLGQVYAGRPGKGLLMFLAIVPTFVVGLWLTAFTCVNPGTYSLEFVAHAFLGLPAGLALQLTDGLKLEELPRWFEVGRLYAAVAGLLNVVAISDALGEVLQRNEEVRRYRSALWHLPAPSPTPAPVDPVAAPLDPVPAQALDALPAAAPDVAPEAATGAPVNGLEAGSVASEGAAALEHGTAAPEPVATPEEPDTLGEAT